MTPWTPQLSPGHSRNTSWTHPEPKSFPKINSGWFRLDFYWILEGFGHQNGSQSASKTCKILKLLSRFAFMSSQGSFNILIKTFENPTVLGVTSPRFEMDLEAQSHPEKRSGTSVSRLLIILPRPLRPQPSSLKSPDGLGGTREA